MKAPWRQALVLCNARWQSSHSATDTHTYVAYTQPDVYHFVLYEFIHLFFFFFKHIWLQHSSFTVVYNIFILWLKLLEKKWGCNYYWFAQIFLASKVLKRQNACVSMYICVYVYMYIHTHLKSLVPKCYKSRLIKVFEWNLLCSISNCNISTWLCNNKKSQSIF